MKYTEEDLLEAFSAGFQCGRKVLCYEGDTDLIKRTIKGFRNWLVKRALR